MARRSKYNWPELIKAFKASSQTQAKFCEENDLNPKYFNQKLGAAKLKESGFSKVQQERSLIAGNEVTLSIGQCKINCPASMSLASIAQLARCLA